jgi:hypothetical protein
VSPESNLPSHRRARKLPERLRGYFSGANGKRHAASVGSAVVLVALIVVLAVTSALGSKARPTPSTKTPQVVSRSTIPPPKIASHLCPLTGTEAPGGVVPQRPAIGVKIGNDPAARPQSGLPEADIVYEEMAEGGVTRYLAVFQCHEAPVLGPVRSVRWDDWHVLASFGHPILAYSGGISYWEQLTANLKWLYDADGSFYPAANAYYRTSDRYPPENLYTSTSALWKLDSRNHTPPPAQFQYAVSPSPLATPAKSVSIVGFSEGENVSWTWSAKLGVWLRWQGSTPDADASGQQLQAHNVVIQVVSTRNEPYYESGTVYGVESITEGHGVAYVLRDGKVEKGTWTTPAYGDTMELRLSNGSVMKLAPGNTWVEMVPKSYPVQVQP